jgi:hypothetical protein
VLLSALAWLAAVQPKADWMVLVLAVRLVFVARAWQSSR